MYISEKSKIPTFNQDINATCFVLLQNRKNRFKGRNMLNTKELPQIESHIVSSPEVLGGEKVFKGTRVPIRTLIDYLEARDRLDDFLYDFPTVTRKQAIAVLETAKAALTNMI